MIFFIIFAAKSKKRMEEKTKIIEKAVCDFYKVDPNDIYGTSKSRYPYGVCKKVLMYMLFKNKVRQYEIATMFNVSNRIANRNITEVKKALLSDTKIKEDIDRINKLLNK